MSSLWIGNIWTVVRFTFLNRFRSKSFIIVSVIFALLISAGINLPSIIEKLSSDKPANVGVLTTNNDISVKLQQYFMKQEKPELNIVLLSDHGSSEANEAAAKEKIVKKELKGYLQFTETAAGGFPNVTYKSEGSMEFSIKSKLQASLQAVKTDIALKDVRLTADQLNSLFAPVTLDTVQITSKVGEAAKGKSETQMVSAYILVYVLLFLLFLTVQLYGSLIATEVTAEKSSRVMELLITSVSPLKQMFGKVIGMFLLGLSQLAVFAIVAGINLNLPNNKDMLAKYYFKWSNIPVSLFVYFLIFFILGFFLYAMLYAAIGSIISRTEDLGQAIMPVTFLMLGSFYIGIYGLNNPTASFVTAMSFVPFFTPLIMFLRIGMADPAFWQIALSIVVLLLCIAVVGWLSAKMYRIGVLMYGKRPTMKEVVKAMQA